MKKINRRTFLQQAGLVTAALAAGMYDQVAARPSSGTAAGSLPSAATDDITSENGRFTAALRDHGRALTNPGMGWTMHFYSNILSNYGSQLEPSDTLDDFPGLSTVYLRVPWAFLEPEEGKFVWELLEPRRSAGSTKANTSPSASARPKAGCTTPRRNGYSTPERRDTTSKVITSNPTTKTRYS